MSKKDKLTKKEKVEDQQIKEIFDQFFDQYGTPPTQLELARMFNVSEPYIRKRLRELGLKTRGMERRTLDDATLLKIYRELQVVHNRPPTLRELVEQLGFGYSCISRKLKQLGLEFTSEKKQTPSSSQIKEEYRKFIEEYHRLPSQYELSYRLGVSASFVAIKLRELKLKSKGQVKRLLTWKEVKEILDNL